jgi:small subunit ribosomal protein S16
MLAIRLQRVGRKGHAMYRLVVQESQRHPLSGRVIAFVGTYDPHTKDAKIQVQTAQKYLDNGAQPSPRVVKLLTDAGVKMPDWVVRFDAKKSKAIRKTDKLRKNQPKVESVKPVEAATAKDEAEVVEVEKIAESDEISEVDETIKK